MDPPTDRRPGTARSRLCQPFHTKSLFFSASTILEERSSSLSVDSDKLSVPLAEGPCSTLCLPLLTLCKKSKEFLPTAYSSDLLTISSLLARALFVCHRIYRKKDRCRRATSKRSRMLRCKRKRLHYARLRLRLKVIAGNNETIGFVSRVQNSGEFFKECDFEQMYYVHLSVVSTLCRENYNTAEMSVVLIVEKIKSRHGSGRFSRLELKIIPRKTSGETCAYSWN